MVSFILFYSRKKKVPRQSDDFGNTTISSDDLLSLFILKDQEKISKDVVKQVK